ncbi:glucokinase [Microbulbifer discodermiae]|uniref:glucokinase n=1 Tax=Microbulbifer sp. 2201CG32-9 TaxID=3232309 RepID=UPI00345B8269
MQESTQSVTTVSQNWKLVADIGGTNARFGLARHGGEGHRGLQGTLVEDIRQLPCAQFEQLEAALESYLQSLPASKVASLSEACLAVAGPVGSDRIAVTNLPWSFSKSSLKRSLGYARFEVINDFAALALSCPGLQGEELARVDTETEPVSEHPMPEEPRVVIGPGTGLGVCGLLRNGNTWRALPGEGGHTTIAPVNEEELAIVQYLRREHCHISAEHLLCGRGLANIHRGLAAIGGQRETSRDPAAITAAALDGSCALARYTVHLFCNLLGSFCGDAVLTLGARGGLYLGGGILPRIEPLLRASDFMSRLRAKGVMSAYLHKLPVYLVRHPFPALVGAAAFLGSEQ